MIAALLLAAVAAGSEPAQAPAPQAQPAPPIPSARSIVELQLASRPQPGSAVTLSTAEAERLAEIHMEKLGRENSVVGADDSTSGRSR